jgi:long-chain acyl-CoA synthetase
VYEASGLSSILQAGLRQRPDEAAIIFEGRGYSYAELERRVSALAARFARSGLAGERIGLILPNGAALVCCYLACFRAGAVAVPVSPSYAAPERLRALGMAAPAWIIAGAPQSELLDGAGDTAASLRQAVFAEAQDGLFAPAGQGDGTFQEYAQPPGQPALIFFTSGSTGAPKGVLHTRQSAFAILTSTVEALGGASARDVILVCEPQVHPSGFIATFSVLLSGGTAVLLDGFDEAQYITALRTHRPSLIVTHIDILMKLLHAPGIRAEDFAGLRGVYTGGDAVPLTLQREFREFTGLPIQIGWGMTEAIWLTVCREGEREKPGCIGRPLTGVELRVAGENGKVLPPGEDGEFWVKGPMVMREYWRGPDATARAFAEGWFRTGDRGHRGEDGRYWFVSRIKDIIVRNTAKLTPGEVEAALSLHPGVRAAAVVGVPDAKEGEVPAAFVVPEPGRSLTGEKLSGFLQTHIASYKIPATYHFIPALPLTQSGKIDRNALQIMASKA